jgi:hypothetical protein
MKHLIKEAARFQKLAGILKEDESSIAANLTKAFNAGPAATRAYLDTPEGSSEEARSLLLKPTPPEDGSAKDDVVQIGNASGQAKEFTPTQNEIDLMKSVSYPLGSAKTLTDAIETGPVAKGIVTSGDLIIDGHHRWSGAIAIGGNNAQISGKDVQWPGQNTSQVLAAAQLTIAAKLGPGKKIPSQSEGFETNILGKDAIKISKMIMANVNKQTDKGAPGPLLNDAMMKDLTEGDNKDIKIVLDWLGKLADRVKDKVGPGKPSTPEAIYQLRLAIATKVGENLAALPANPEAPARKDMPQFDTKVGGPELSTIETELESGKFNISPPFKKESVNARLDSMLSKSIIKL